MSADRILTLLLAHHEKTRLCASTSPVGESQSVGILEVAASDESTLQLGRDVLIVSPLMRILVGLDPLHGIYFHAFILQCGYLGFRENDSCVELFPFLAFLATGLVKPTLNLGTAGCVREILITILFLRRLPCWRLLRLGRHQADL